MFSLRSQTYPSDSRLSSESRDASEQNGHMVTACAKSEERSLHSQNENMMLSCSSP